MPQPSPSPSPARQDLASRQPDLPEAAFSLREREAWNERYRLLFEQARDGVWLADRQGRFLDVNPSACRMLGYDRGANLRLSMHDLLRGDELPRLDSTMRRLAAGQQVSDTWMLRRADGSDVQVELGHTLTGDGVWQAIGRVTQEPSEPQAHAHGHAQDGELLARLAHELRNPLAPLRNGLEVIRRAGCDDDTTQRVAQIMDRQLGQMAKLINDLLDASRASGDKHR